jgi:hypothetical protein
MVTIKDLLLADSIRQWYSVSIFEAVRILRKWNAKDHEKMLRDFGGEA